MDERPLASTNLEMILKVYALSLHDENILESIVVRSIVVTELRLRIYDTLAKIENGYTAHQAYNELIK